MFQVLYECTDPWPEERTLRFNAQLNGEIKISPELARCRANGFLTMDVGVLLGVDDPVLVWGERWEAVSQDGQPISAGEQVEVTEMKGFRLKVKKTQ